MRFPEVTLRSHADFRKWDSGIGKNIASNTHTLEQVEANVLGRGRYQADIVASGRPNRGKVITLFSGSASGGSW